MRARRKGQRLNPSALAHGLAGDADTTGAVYGQLAGAYYGMAGIPEGWVEKIAGREVIEQLAEGLLGGGGA